jgi:SAM-dependent methyltransferase
MGRALPLISEAVDAWRNRLATPAAWARAHYDALERCRDVAARLLGRDAGLRALDLGCGRVPHATMVFDAWGWRVTGIDIGPVTGSWITRMILEIRTEGWERAAKSIARQLLVEGRYVRELRAAAGRPLPRRGLDMRRMSACEMSFPHAEFDLVFSTAALEHIVDVGGALDEVARVLKPQGFVYIGFAPFQSLSGGHVSAWQRVFQGYVPTDVPPWDHLREQRSTPPVYINRMRLGEYRAEFEKRFDIIEWRRTEEGRELLTPEIRAELPDCAEEELVTRTVTVTARRRC